MRTIILLTALFTASVCSAQQLVDRRSDGTVAREFTVLGDVARETAYDDAGHVTSVGRYVDGLPDGKWTGYCGACGRVTVRGRFEDGRRDGRWVFVTPSGRVVLRYEEGALVGAPPCGDLAHTH